LGVALTAILLVIRSVAGFEWRAVVAYLVCGAVAGLLFGSCIPYTRTRLGASLVGIVVITPILVAQALFEGLELWTYVFTAIAVGGLAGYLTRDQVFKELDYLAANQSTDARNDPP